MNYHGCLLIVFDSGASPQKFLARGWLTVHTEGKPLVSAGEAARGHGLRDDMEPRTVSTNFWVVHVEEPIWFLGAAVAMVDAAYQTPSKWRGRGSHRAAVASATLPTFAVLSSWRRRPGSGKVQCTELRPLAAEPIRVVMTSRVPDQDIGIHFSLTLLPMRLHKSLVALC